MDVFSNSGGVHAAACVTLAFLDLTYLSLRLGLVMNTKP
jgi:hypothetical protein